MSELPLPSAPRPELTIDERSYLAALCRAVPYHLVERVLADPTEAALSLQKSDGVGLFIDLVDFTSTTEKLTQAGGAALGVLAKLLDALFTRLHVEAFFPNQGFVVEFAGDAMTVVFRGDQSAQRAAAAALKAQQVVTEECAKSPEPLLRLLQARVGLASGRIHLAVVGDLARRASIATGSAVHGAIAMQAKAKPGQTVTDAVTARALIKATTTQLEPDLFVLDALRQWPAAAPLEKLGHRLDEQVSEKIALLEPFVSAPLARRLRTTPNGWRIETEVRHAVVVFAELAGFKSRSEALLDSSLLMSRSLLRAFQKYDGLVLKVMATATGHQAMVLFGVHRPSDNDNEKAVLASLEAITRLASFRSSEAELSIKVGIHHGAVLFGAVGSDAKHDLTAIGDAVNLAARVASKANALEVVVTEAVHEAIAGTFTTSPVGPLTFKGKHAPVSVFAVHGIAGVHAHYARRRQTQRFSAGRDTALAKLEQVTDAALGGHASFVGLIGAAGTGKSHLLSGLVDRWVGQGGTAVVGRCQLSTQSTPLAPVRQFFEAFLGISPNDSEVNRMQRLGPSLRASGIGHESTELISFLQPVRRPDGVDETSTDFSQPETRERLMRSVVAFANARFQQNKTLYVLEDLHFADTLTLELVRHLSLLPRDRAFLMVVTGRPLPMLDELRRSLHHELEIAPLDLRAAKELVCHELRASQADAELMAFLFSRTAGNPEYLVQTLRFLADRFLIRVSEGVVTTGRLGAVTLDEMVPPTWQQVALARLDGLTEIERRVLRTASAIGFTFSEKLLEETDVVLSPDTIRHAVEALETQQLVVNDPAAVRAYSFRDELTRTMAYSVIPQSERKTMHARIATVLQSTEPSQWPALAATIAHHLERADQLADAVRWFERVVEQTGRAGLTREQAHFTERLQRVKARLVSQH